MAGPARLGVNGHRAGGVTSDLVSSDGLSGIG
jgi:hypothetical protein